MLFLLLIIPGCRTLPNNKIELPPTPERTDQPTPETLKDYALVINYYEHLVERWEIWSESVKELLQSENP